MLAAVDAAALRDEFPVLRRIAYLNAGTDGPVPSAAVRAVATEVERQAESGRWMEHFMRRFELMTRQREAYAALLGCQPSDVALTTSTSEGVAIALSGLDIGPGDEILTSDEEHPGLIGPLQAARDERGAEIRVVPFRELADAVGRRTCLVACSHVSYVSGDVAPAELAEVDVPVLLDGAQGIGAVPLDVGRLACDVYAGAGQKWLCGPDGTGMLFVAEPLRDRLAVHARSYLSFEDPGAEWDAQLHPDARRFDTPTLPSEGQAFALAALETLARPGWEAVHERAIALAGLLADRLRERGRDVAPRGDTTLVAFASDDAEDERNRLVEQGVVVRDLPGRDKLRASVGAWNTEDDIGRLLDGLD
jgi:L-cysteine/cystine lyase